MYVVGGECCMLYVYGGGMWCVRGMCVCDMWYVVCMYVVCGVSCVVCVSVRCMWCGVCCMCVCMCGIVCVACVRGMR